MVLLCAQFEMNDIVESDTYRVYMTKCNTHDNSLSLSWTEDRQYLKMNAMVYKQLSSKSYALTMLILYFFYRRVNNIHMLTKLKSLIFILFYVELIENKSGSNLDNMKRVILGISASNKQLLIIDKEIYIVSACHMRSYQKASGSLHLFIHWTFF